MSIFSIATLRASRMAVAVAMALSPLTVTLAADAPDATTLDVIQVQGIAPELAEIKAEQSLTPGGVSVVDGEALHERAVNNLGDALRYVPGVWAASSSGAEDLLLSIRGSNLDATGYDRNGVKLLQNGLPVTTADGNNHNRFLDPLAARYAVIARGANALAYGASTLGGAINFISPTARNSSPMQLFVTGGSHGLLTGRLTAGGVSGDFDGLVTLESKDWDGYREHSRQDRVGLYANAGWQASEDFKLRMFATHVDSDSELPGSLTCAQVDADRDQANPSAITGNYQKNVTADRLAAKASWNVSANSQLVFGLSYEQQSLYHPIVDKIMVDFDGPGPMAPVEVFSLLIDTDQRTLGGMVRYHLTAGDHDVLAGINFADTREDGGHYRNDSGRRNGQTEVVDNNAGSVELFLLDRWMLAPDWTLVYGAQGVFTDRDVRTISPDSGDVRNPKGDFSSFNPRVGVIHALSPDNDAFTSISRLYEAPTIFELENDVRGDNSILEAMHGTVVEVGMRGGTAAPADAPAWHWDVSLYYAQIRDEILSVEDPTRPGTSLSANIDRTTHAGFEALVGASFPLGDGAHRIEPRVSATFNEFRFDNDPVYGDNRLPAAPDYAVRGEVMYRHDSGFFAGPTFDLVGTRHADFSNAYRIGSHQLLGLRAGLERERWEVFGEVRNLLDEDYIGRLSVRNRAGADDAVLQPGAPRSVYVGMRLRF